MKSWIIIFSLFAALFSLAPAHAELQQVLKVHADYFPNREYAIGLDLDANEIITRMYFETNGAKEFYTLDQLNDFTTIFSVAGIKMVQLRIAQRTSTDSAIIELSYSTNYLRGTRESLFFNASLNPATHQYDVTDNRTRGMIHEVSVNTRYSLFLPIGISSIEVN